MFNLVDILAIIRLCAKIPSLARMFGFYLQVSPSGQKNLRKSPQFTVYSVKVLGLKFLRVLPLPILVLCIKALRPLTLLITKNLNQRRFHKALKDKY